MFNNTIFKYVTCENGCERGLTLQSPKKMDSVPDDLIRNIFKTSNVNQANNTLKNQPLDQNDSGNADTQQIVKDDDDGNDVDAKAAKHNGRAHFVEIGEFSCGSIFGLGEKMDDRVILAKHSAVQCLLIPHYWLFQKKQNAGNIWQRTKIYLDFALPSRQQVFEHYLIHKKWKSYKKKLIRNSNRLKPQINTTQMEDVPIICRLEETL